MKSTAGGGKALLVALPSKPNDKELANLGPAIVKWINGHTGCPCLSGVISVILEDEMAAQAVQVDLARAG
jgi:hypothetical protein